MPIKWADYCLNCFNYNLVLHPTVSHNFWSTSNIPFMGFWGWRFRRLWVFFSQASNLRNKQHWLCWLIISGGITRGRSPSILALLALLVASCTFDYGVYLLWLKGWEWEAKVSSKIGPHQCWWTEMPSLSLVPPHFYLMSMGGFSVRSFIRWQPWLREPLQKSVGSCAHSQTWKPNWQPTGVLVTSHLDYCNVFCKRLPLVPNAAAHVIRRSPWCTYVTRLFLWAARVTSNLLDATQDTGLLPIKAVMVKDLVICRSVWLRVFDFLLM